MMDTISLLTQNLNQCIVCICKAMETKGVYSNACNFYAADKISDATVQSITLQKYIDVLEQRTIETMNHGQN